MMHVKPLIWRMILILVLASTGCSVNRLDEPIPKIPDLPALTPTVNESLSATPTPMPIPAAVPVLDLDSLEGPLLLLQTDFDQFQYIDLKTNQTYPFKPSPSVSRLRLSVNLSPSGRLMFLPVDERTASIIDLSTSQVVHTVTFSSAALFTPEAAASKAAPLVTELALSESGLLDAVREAHQSSKQILRWYQSDRYHLSVHDTGETSTGLFLDDHDTGSRVQLEDHPGLVEDYRSGGDGNLILLKKGLVFWPGAFRDDAYYLVNVNDRSTRRVVLPADIQNPAVTWFSNDSIGVIHRAFMAGGAGYSLINIDTLEATQIITGDFSDLRRMGEFVLVTQLETDPETTRFELITTQGERVAVQEIDRRCFYQYALGSQIMIQCELESFILNQELTIEPFFDSVLTLSSSPNGTRYVMINRSEQSFLLDADLSIQAELQLEETPLEILWLPDSSGFLYRTHGRLFYFDLVSETTRLLIESDLFSDYSNLNVVWVNLE